MTEDHWWNSQMDMHGRAYSFKEKIGSYLCRIVVVMQVLQVPVHNNKEVDDMMLAGATLYWWGCNRCCWCQSPVGGLCQVTAAHN